MAQHGKYPINTHNYGKHQCECIYCEICDKYNQHCDSSKDCYVGHCDSEKIRQMEIEQSFLTLLDNGSTVKFPHRRCCSCNFILPISCFTQQRYICDECVELKK